HGPVLALFGARLERPNPDRPSRGVRRGAAYSTHLLHAHVARQCNGPRQSFWPSSPYSSPPYSSPAVRPRQRAAARAKPIATSAKATSSSATSASSPPTNPPT